MDTDNFLELNNTKNKLNLKKLAWSGTHFTFGKKVESTFTVPRVLG